MRLHNFGDDATKKQKNGNESNFNAGERGNPKSFF